MEEINLDLESISHKNISFNSMDTKTKKSKKNKSKKYNISKESNIGLDLLVNRNKNIRVNSMDTHNVEELAVLSNARKRLEQQKNITSTASTSAKTAEVGRVKSRLILENAQKTFADSVKNEEETKSKEIEASTFLVTLQREYDELIYAARRDEIARKKQLIKETYEAQLADIEADEITLGRDMDEPPNINDILNDMNSNYCESDNGGDSECDSESEIEGPRNLGGNINKKTINLDI
jgi:hypothetical protein